MKQWVFKIKQNCDENLIKYKIYWVIHDYKQQENVNFYEIFILIIWTNSWKLILTLCVFYRLYIHYYDVVTVFLNKILDKSFYIIYFIRFEEKDYVLKLLKILYDLKKLLHVWYAHLCEHLEVIELVISFYDLSVFVNKGLLMNLIVTVYVNDLLICSEFMKLINNVLKHLQTEFEMTDLSEVMNYLNMKINVAVSKIIVC